MAVGQPRVTANTHADGQIRDHTQRKTQEPGAWEDPRWRAGSQGHRVAAGPTAEGIRQLVVATADRTSGGTVDRGVGQLGDDSSNAKKNGMTRRKIEFWVIPPKADAEFGEILPPLILHGVIVLAFLGNAAWRLSRRMIIGVTHDELAVAIVNRFGAGSRMNWSRITIGEVKFNASNGKLLIRIPGQEFVEYFISSKADVTRWVATTVNQAVFQNEFEPAGVAAPFPMTRISPPRWSTAALVAAGGVLLMASGPIIGIASGGSWSDWLGLGLCGGFSVFIIAAGITLGTQEKDFYF